jgi:hypothetical protein
MDRLAVVEEKLGSVDTWPSIVLKDMFYEEPRVSVSIKVAAFLHGNGVSAKDAAKMYKVTHAAWRTSQRLICTGGIWSGASKFLTQCSTLI